MLSGDHAAYEGAIFAPGQYTFDSYLHLHRREKSRAAARVVARIRYAAEQLGDFPRMGRPGIVPPTYELAVKSLPNIIVDEIHSDPGVVAVLGIFHGAQDRSV